MKTQLITHDGITYETTNFPCPCCGHGLLVSVAHKPVTVYCGFGPCKHSELNEGFEGNSVEDCISKMIDFLESLPGSIDLYHYQLAPRKEINPTSPGFEHNPLARLMVPTFEEMTGAD